jgi:isocitrate dehydrogenase
MALDGGSIAQADIIGLLEKMRSAGLDFIKMETLCTFDDEPGYSLGQGQ